MLCMIEMFLWFFVFLPFKVLWVVVTGPIFDPEESEKWAGRN